MRFGPWSAAVVVVAKLAAAAPGVRVATTPPSPPPVEPRPVVPQASAAAAATPGAAWTPLAPIVPFGPWYRPRPSGPGPKNGPGNPVPPRETPGKHEPQPYRVPVMPGGAVAPLVPVEHRAHLPSAVVLRVLDRSQAAFRACWVRAHRQNATPSSGKVQVHVEVDVEGKVTAAHSDTDAAVLDRCLCNVAAHLAFPPRDEPASAELSLLFPVGD